MKPKSRKHVIIWGLVFLSLCIVLSLPALVGYTYFYRTEFFSAFLVPVKNGPQESTDIDGNEIDLPKPSEWVDYGPVLEAGPEGSWDFQWAGITPISVVKKDETYYFYYVGSDGYRSFDGGPRHRSIGVATSHDGIRFTKYTGNPILTHAPFNGEEEGANSGGVSLSSDGKFVMYYGAARGPEDIITSDIRVAVSNDGFNFTDVTKVADHRNPFLYGFGDEIFPIAAFQHDEKWYVYYNPNGGYAPGRLGMVWGPELDKLPNSIKVLDESSGGLPVNAWGNVITLSPDKIAVFIQRLRWPETFIEVRTASPDAPHKLSEPVERYDIPVLKRGAVFLDRERNTWFLYYNNFDRFWDVKLAPAGEVDSSPPTSPGNLTATALHHDEVMISWDGAEDPDTGVVLYNIYRDGVKIGSTIDLTYTDHGLTELNTYSYGISAVNLHGTEGPRSMVDVAMPADDSPLSVAQVIASGDPTKVTVVFNKKVESDSSTQAANYSISNDIEIIDAILSDDEKKVVLKTSEHVDNQVYSLAVSDIHDQSSLSNIITPGTNVVYSYSSIQGLVGYWNLDQGEGDIALDISGYQNDGSIYGASWQNGRLGGALGFDGFEDYVSVEDARPLDNLTNKSFTIAAWVKPEALPPGGKAFSILRRASSYPPYSFGLIYTAAGKYQAKVVTLPSETSLTPTSQQMGVGTWRHVAMVVDVVSHKINLYVDGVLVNSALLPDDESLLDLNEPVGEKYSAGEYYIGSNKPDQGAGSFFNSYFQGMIDDVRIYNRALESNEIQIIFEYDAQR